MLQPLCPNCPPLRPCGASVRFIIDWWVNNHNSLSVRWEQTWTCASQNALQSCSHLMGVGGVRLVAQVLQRMLTHGGGECQPFRAEPIFWPVIITLTNVQLLIFRALVSWKQLLTWDPFEEEKNSWYRFSRFSSVGSFRFRFRSEVHHFPLRSLSLRSELLPSQNGCSQLRAHYPEVWPCCFLL